MTVPMDVTPHNAVSEQYAETPKSGFGTKGARAELRKVE
jgi:hypothetical protein